jgi:hypothetical protein
MSKLWLTSCVLMWAWSSVLGHESKCDVCACVLLRCDLSLNIWFEPLFTSIRARGVVTRVIWTRSWIPKLFIEPSYYCVVEDIMLGHSYEGPRQFFSFRRPKMMVKRLVFVYGTMICICRSSARLTRCGTDAMIMAATTRTATANHGLFITWSRHRFRNRWKCHLLQWII